MDLATCVATISNIDAGCDAHVLADAKGDRERLKAHIEWVRHAIIALGIVAPHLRTMRHLAGVSDVERACREHDRVLKRVFMVGLGQSEADADQLLNNGRRIVT